MKWIFGTVLSLSAFTTMAATLTQAEFDQQLAVYTKVINDTKPILEGENSNKDVELQKQAFCQRLSAYHAIADLAQQNPSLQQAYLMGVIAHRYLDRQKQSMSSAGMTEQYFCGDLLKMHSSE